MSKAKAKRFSKFPQVVFLTHEDDSNGGYFLEWELETDAAEHAETNNSQVAVYHLASQATLGIHCEAVEIDE
jgi:hypothetical protein